METVLRQQLEANGMKYKFQYLTAVTQANKSIWTWFNGQAIHSAPLALNLVHNALIQLHLGEDHSIQISNKPLAFQSSKDLGHLDLETAHHLLLMIVLVLTYMYSLSVAFYIKEKVCNAKFLQFASRANVPIFWGASILWDLITICITIGIIVGTLLLSKNAQWKNPTVLGYLPLVLFMCSIAMIPLVCILSLMLSKPSLGTSIVFTFSIILGKHRIDILFKE